MVTFIGIFLATFIISGCSKETVEPTLEIQYDASIKSIDDDFVFKSLTIGHTAYIAPDLKKELIRNLNTTFILCDYVEIDGDSYKLNYSKQDAQKIGIPEEQYNTFVWMLKHQEELLIEIRAIDPTFKIPDFRANHQKQRSQIFPDGYIQRKPIEK